MMRLSCALLVFTLSAVHAYDVHAVQSSFAVHLSHPVHKAPRELLSRILKSDHAIALPSHPGHYTATARLGPSSNGLRSSPGDFGGDPTGVHDSTMALRQCIAVCLNQSALSPNGNFPGDTSFNNGRAVRDMGGCHVDLAGGEFLISAPLYIPEYNANMIFGGGSLVASKHFVGDFMIVIGVKGSCKVPQGSCNIDINFPELFLDGSHATSAMQINNVMGVTIGPGGYLLNFTAYGVQINAGHEVMVDRCWLGETNFDFDFEKEKTVPNATAIEINGNDHYVLNTIVFSSRVGVAVHGAADYITGTHVWFPINRALDFMAPPVSAMAFYITGGGNRFSGCYADGGRCVFEGSGLSRNTWTNGFECCAGSGLEGINHGIILRGTKVGPGLQITHNLFNGGSIWHEPSTMTLTRSDNSCSSQFKFNVSAVQCDGLTHASEADSSAEACEKRCCAQQSEGTCSVWQWCDLKTAGCGCWFDASSGGAPQCHGVHSAGPWVGASTSSIAPPTDASVVGTRIQDNNFGGKGVGTRASLTQSGGGNAFEFNFCDQLVFKQIAIVRSITVMASGNDTYSTRAGVPQGCKLTVFVTPAVPTSGVVFVEVDSSQYDGNFV